MVHVEIARIDDPVAGRVLPVVPELVDRLPVERAARTPEHDLLARLAHHLGHGGDEIGILDLHLVGAEVYEGRVEEGAHLAQHIFENRHPLGRFHPVAGGAHEGVAVAGHVDLGNHHDMALRAPGDELPDFPLGVELALVADLVLGRGQLGMGRDLEPPSDVLGEVEVEDVHLVARHDVDPLPHEPEGNEVAAHVEHDAAHGEGGPVDDRATGQGRFAATPRRELPQGLGSIGEPCSGRSDKPHTIGGHLETVGLAIVIRRRQAAEINTHVSHARFARIARGDDDLRSTALL